MKENLVPSRSSHTGRSGQRAPADKNARLLADAFAFFNKGQNSASRELAKKILRREPRHRDARQLMAMIAFDEGNTEAALRELNALAAEFPDHAPVLNELGTVLIDLMNYEQAERVLVKAVNLQPNNPGLHLNLAVVYRKIGMLDDAERHASTAIRLKRDYIDAFRAMAEILGEQGRAEDAVKAAEWANRLAPADLRSLVCLADTLNAANNLDGARSVYQQAMNLGSDNLLAQVNYQQFLAERGFLDEAAEMARRLLEINPDQPDPYLTLSRARTFERRDELMERMEAILERMDNNTEGRALLHFALAKANEDIKDYPQAFEHSLKGNALTRASKYYSAEATAKEFANLQRVFTPALISQLGDAGHDDDTPIFVLGMPRSGTTLTEQILSSHDAVHGAGELVIMGLAVRELRQRLGARDDADLAAKASPQDWRALGAAYVTQLRRKAPKARYIVDKMPANFKFLGYIRLALPKAKVIYCSRAAPDNCVSIFNIQFSTPGMGYGYDLTELGGYYRKHAELMRHWQQIMPGFFFTNRYEDMVADQEAQTRRILEFCGLDWDDNVLNFFANARRVHTASQSQVRQPIYKSSIGRYKRYGPAVQPLLDALDWDEDRGEIRL